MIRWTGLAPWEFEDYRALDGVGGVLDHLDCEGEGGEKAFSTFKIGLKHKHA